MLEKYNKVVRAAIYIRVSKKEQVLNGYSLENQRAALLEYCKQMGYKVINIYVDAGITARKQLHKRLGFQQMMKAVDNNEIDLIIVLRLDRFFRNVYDYHKMMNEHLIPHKVDWKASKEEYDTTTPNGRMLINMKMAISEMECDTDSVRIKDIQEYLVSEGRTLSGEQCLSFGYQIVNKKIVINKDNEEMCRDIIKTFFELGSVRKTEIKINSIYNKTLAYKSVYNFLSNTMIYGSYRGNENYCEAYITKEQYNIIISMLSKNIKNNTTQNRFYIFSGMLKCKWCGNVMAGFFSQGIVPTKNYRCNKHHTSRTCDNCYTLGEKRLTKKLWDRVMSDLKDDAVKTVITKVEPDKKHKSNIDNIRQKQQNLNDLYINNFIQFEEYKHRYEELEKQITPDAEPQNMVSIGQLQAYIDDVRGTYDTLSDEEKSSFWRGFIDYIVIGNHEIIEVKYL